MINIIERAGKLFLSPTNDGLKVEVRSLGNAFIVDDRLLHGPTLTLEDNRSHPWRSFVSEGPDRQARCKPRSLGWADRRIWLGSRRPLCP